MSFNISPKSSDTELSELMRDVSTGKIQLPEFQRNWTWDNNRIIGIIASLSQGYPMGAIMRLAYGNENVKFKYRAIEGVNVSNIVPEHLILDGQQRLTSIYRATCSKDPVDTKTDKGKTIKRYYYLDINKCLDPNEDREDAVISVPEDRKIKTNFDREIILDLSSKELEYEQEMFPLNIIFDSNLREDWGDGFKGYHSYSATALEKYRRFRTEVVDVITGYKLPVITLDKNTPRDAVCKVFENVNTGGVPLTVFELVTATFASYDFDLRNDWKTCEDIIHGKDEALQTDLMNGVDETAFLTAITLYTTYHKNTMTTCKKKDVLSLSLEDYKANRDKLLAGYKMARTFILHQYIFRMRDLPYTTQLIPLSAICAEIGESSFNQQRTQRILEKWFWCGIMGEMYGGANETRYANDIEDVVAEINGLPSQSRTINSAYFSAARLTSLQTRNSAAYKGIMALIYKNQCLDFMRGTPMNLVKSIDEAPDIHHIFPEAYCLKNNLMKEKWNSIVNKSPLMAATNRQIGGEAPSSYSKKIMTEAAIDKQKLRERVQSHLVNFDYFIADDFDRYFIDRAKSILGLIEKAMDKIVSDKGAEQTVHIFGSSLE